ncbi:MAG: AzlD domain-containing protein [Microthrixaceae bacterium]
MTLLAIVVVGIGSYVFRSVFILALADRTPPELVSKALRNVGPAVLSALVATDLWGPNAPTVGAPELAGVVAAGLAAWRTRNLIASVVAGMVVRWVLMAIGV